jgi:quercetin dioxygenase-like cupin family protein
MPKIGLTAAACMMLFGGLAPLAAQAQLPGTRRTDLQRHDLSIPGREVIQSKVELDPGVTSVRHRHPGEEVLEGSLEYDVEGRAPVVLGAGDVLLVPAGKVHSARNVGRGNGAELATYIVEKGKPLIEVVK